MGKSRQVVRLKALIRREGDSFTASVPSLPGAVSFGDTLEEAKRAIREAAEGVIESYLEQDGEIPWRTEPPQGADPSAQDIPFEFTVDV